MYMTEEEVKESNEVALPYEEVRVHPEKATVLREKDAEAMRELDSFIRGAADMMSFGFADEIAAGLGAATGIDGEFGDYSGNLARQREIDRYRREEDPVASIGGQIVGSLAGGYGLVRSGLSLSSRAGGAGLGTRVAAGSADTGAMGSLYGFGAGEGGVENRLENAALMGGLGLAFGGLLPAAMTGARAAYQGLKRAFFGGNPVNPVSSKGSGLYNPPDKPQRPFEADYPNGAAADDTGRLLFDIEGRPLTARYVAGRNVVGEGEKRAGPEELVAIAERSVREGVERVAPRHLGRAQGRLSYNEYTLAPLKIEISTALDDAGYTKVLAHEVGHAIDQMAGEIKVSGLSKELKHLFNTLSTGQERTRHLTLPAHFGYKKDEVPREYMAEAIRAYLGNPNYIKTLAPKTAAAIRRAVNDHPILKDIIQFNSLGGLGLTGMGLSEEGKRTKRSMESLALL